MALADHGDRDSCTQGSSGRSAMYVFIWMLTCVLHNKLEQLVEHSPEFSVVLTNSQNGFVGTLEFVVGKSVG